MAQNRKTRKVRAKLRATDDEWHRIVMKARAAGVPIARYIREALCGAPPQRRAGRGVGNVVNALIRVQTNLRQLEVIAKLDGDEHWFGRIAATAAAVDSAIGAMPSRYAEDAAADLVVAITGAGQTLNLLARQANTDEELPRDHELDACLREVEAMLHRVAEA